MATLRGHTSTVAGLAFSPDGDRLVSASHDHTVKLWDIDACEVVLTLTGHTGEVTGVAFAPDGYRLASCSFDQTVRLWSAVPSGPSEQPVVAQASGTDAPGESNKDHDVPEVAPVSKPVLPDMSGFGSMS
jgi:WD40 repeat protein